MRRDPTRRGRSTARSLPANPALVANVPEGTGALDRIDCRILLLLQEEGRITNAELAARIGLSASPCLRRVRRLEAEGYIQKYSAVLSAEKVGFGATVFVHVSITESTSAAIAAFRAAVAKIPQILACHAVSGNEDFLLIVLTHDLESFKRFNDETLLHLPHVSKKVSSFSLDAMKQSYALPLELLPAFRAAVTDWRR
jgi:Lrp/AsnC family transcriptional regulator, leucine-responsive regulatory protein